MSIPKGIGQFRKELLAGSEGLLRPGQRKEFKIMNFFKTVWGISVLVLVGLVAGFFIGRYYTVWEVSNAVKKAYSQIQVTQTNSQSAPTPVTATVSVNGSSTAITMPAVTQANIGQEVDLPNLKVTVLSSKEETSVSDGYQNSTPDAGSVFVVVNLTATNTTNNSFALPTDPFLIVDNQGRSYEVAAEADVNNSITYRNMLPGIAQTGNMVFEVPTGEAGRLLTNRPVQR